MQEHNTLLREFEAELKIYRRKINFHIDIYLVHVNMVNEISKGFYQCDVRLFTQVYSY